MWVFLGGVFIKIVNALGGIQHLVLYYNIELTSNPGSANNPTEDIGDPEGLFNTPKMMFEQMCPKFIPYGMLVTRFLLLLDLQP